MKWRSAPDAVVKAAVCTNNDLTLSTGRHIVCDLYFELVMYR